MTDDDDLKSDDPRWAWGCKAIGEEIDLTEAQVRYLHGIGAFKKSAVRKLSHKQFVGDRHLLRTDPWVSKDERAAAAAQRQRRTA